MSPPGKMEAKTSTFFSVPMGCSTGCFWIESREREGCKLLRVLLWVGDSSLDLQCRTDFRRAIGNIINSRRYSPDSHPPRFICVPSVVIAKRKIHRNRRKRSGMKSAPARPAHQIPMNVRDSRSSFETAMNSSHLPVQTGRIRRKR
jgi:hypothetical protein